MDTVEPKQGGEYSVFGGDIDNGKLYGLGAADMKGGIAAILAALDKIKNKQGFTLLFYCDEEYGFQGMKKYLAEEKAMNGMAVIAEPSNLQIWNLNKGIIEINFSVFGKSGHASNPKSGNNAIDGIYKILVATKNWLKKIKSVDLGDATLNLAYLRGGLNLGQDINNEKLIGKQGNNIADYAEAVIDVRSSSKMLQAEQMVKFLDEQAKLLGLRFDYKINHNFGSLETEKKYLKNIGKIIKNNIGECEYLNPNNLGYGDGQLIQQKFNIPVINFGPIGGNTHGADEWVDVTSLEKTRDIFTELIDTI